MSVNLAISLVAQSQANAAAAQADTAHRIACSALMQGYQHSVERMHEYANCVGLLYPDATDYFWLKVAMWVIVAFIIGGAAVNKVVDDEGFKGGVFGFFIGLGVVGLGILTAWSFGS